MRSRRPVPSTKEAAAGTPRIHIGTSGWHYPHWVGPVYPGDMPPHAFLGHYARLFRAVEVNNTFYRMPDPATLARWRDATPDGFVFACKANRFITHMKKLKDPADSTPRFFEAIETLGVKLGPILFQLLPRWRVDADRLAAFLAALPARHRYAFEFRDESWFDPAVYDVLRKHRAAFCIYDLAGRRSPNALTADFAYVRLHGPDGAYRGRYDGRTLHGWARRFANWAEDRRDVYCFFDNDEAGYAAQDAERLQRSVHRLSSRWGGRRHSVPSTMSRSARGTLHMQRSIPKS